MSVLGPLELRVGSAVLPMAGPKQRAVLAMLALHGNQVVSVDSLVDAVWGDRAPDRADHTLQQHVSAVRKLFDSAGQGSSASAALITRSPGYLLRVAALDVDEFERASSAGSDAATRREWSTAIAAFDAALSCWRGAALADTRDSAKLSAAAVRLDEARIAVLEARVEALLESGRARDAVPELEHLVDEYPFREQLRAQLMLALYRCGRQADALAAYQSARLVLTENLGIEPGADLRDLERSILLQLPKLDGASASSARERELYATFVADDRSTYGYLVFPDGQLVLLADGTTIIGRDESAQVRLVDSRVSRRHAEIVNAQGRALLRDLGSTNGTTINGTPVESHALSDGDVVNVGGVELRFHRPDD